MPGADEYRKHAQDCAMLALQTKDPNHKRQLQQIADTWLKLAAEAERRERGKKNETPSAS
jgi:hypothetical protein